MKLSKLRLSCVELSSLIGLVSVERLILVVTCSLRALLSYLKNSGSSGSNNNDNNNSNDNNSNNIGMNNNNVNSLIETIIIYLIKLPSPWGARSNRFDIFDEILEVMYYRLRCRLKTWF